MGRREIDSGSLCLLTSSGSVSTIGHMKQVLTNRKIPGREPLFQKSQPAQALESAPRIFKPHIQTTTSTATRPSWDQVGFGMSSWTPGILSWLAAHVHPVSYSPNNISFHSTQLNFWIPFMAWWQAFL